ncbi:thiamine phosphate synthase [Pseudobacteriovorax antillogorgiicola]|uniref:Thiamine-phosphate synthase n=1 Tax=Pseudobacteriovorax antillogorgiicola TaxID=1513793 RepID=A0A1Y6BMR2_9BACT|nr:thiamine phosphate synthase [Pseudobacteriovorax antillogorgiicola]TCS53941.1 thiamine-phosphate diphosphorylase [Pseudobacteriovorax antillogorgiicola]SMF20258.1 thiamine-phosphate diphosphorylase [Pseudobacteriovorax antillogorgiicola]
MTCIWSIAGSDPLACSGIQADQRAAQAQGVHCCTILTAQTSQNHEDCHTITAVPAADILEQSKAVQLNSPADAIKIGMLAAGHSVTAVAEITRSMKVPVVYDPVLKTSSGGLALGDNSIAIIREQLLPTVTVLTPNIPEAEALVGFPITSTDDFRRAAQELRSLGAHAVLIKGGHGPDDEDATDYFHDGERAMWLTSPRSEGEYRGTGCYLSTAIACGLAQGLDPREAVVQGRIHLMEAMDSSYPLGAARILIETKEPRQMPLITYESTMSNGAPFLGTGLSPLGFYPVVPSVDWLNRLLPLGVTTIQLRIKNLSPEETEDQVKQAVSLARKYRCRLFINDYWQLAIRHNAYGVHLGQEDLEDADVAAIQKAGLRLGISTHSLEELGRALVYQPSYIALGPIFPTTCKSMSFGPQGMAKVATWKRLSPCPIVAIGGLKPEHVTELKSLGADGLALISDVTEAENPEERACEWLRLVEP